MISGKSPKYSIIVPVYNTEKYLGYCLDSIVAQTYRNFEVVIVNDGSTDSSPSICERYQEQYPDIIRIVNQSNHGLLLARRAGFAASKGEVLLTVDSDDAVHEQLLEKVDEAFSTHDPDMVCFTFSREPDFSTISPRTPFEEDRVFEGDDIVEVCQSICNTRTINFIWAKAFKRSIAQTEEMYDEYAGLSCSEDLLQVLPMIDKCSRIAFLHEALYYYRLNTNSITKSFSFKNYLDNQRTGLVRLSYAKQWEERYGAKSLVDGSLFMSLRETCEVLVRIASLYNLSEAEPYYAAIRAGELYGLSSQSQAARARLVKYYRLVLYLFDHGRLKTLSLVSRFGLKLKKFVVKQV